MNGTNFNTRNFLKSDAHQADQLKQNLDSSISSRNKIEEQTNRDLLDAFLISENAVHIDNEAENVQRNRENQKDSATKVNVISGINSTITFKGKTLQKQDHPEIYAQYNTIVKDATLSEDEKLKKLESLDRLITARASLMTANNSIMYTFKRRIYFSTSESRNEIFAELNKVEPFKGKIEITDQDLSGEIHYIIKRKDEITKRKQDPKPIKPTPQPITPDPKTDDPKIDIDTDNESNSEGGNSEVHATGGKVENSGNITQKVEVDMQPIADAIKETNTQLIQVLSNNTTTGINGNSDIQILSDKLDLLFKQFMMINNNPIINNNTLNGGGMGGTEYINIVNKLNDQFNTMVTKLEQTFDIKFENFKKQMEETNDKNIQVLIKKFKKVQKKIVKQVSKKVNIDIETLKKDLDTKINNLEKNLGIKLDGIKTKFENEFKGLHTKIDNLTKEIGKIEGMIKSIKLSQDNMEKTLKDLQKGQEDLEKQLNDVLKELDELKKKLDDCCKKKKLDDDPTPNTHEVKQEAVISNVTEISREEAEKIAENELREKYGNMSWLNPKRYLYFYAREYITKNRTQKIMNTDGRKGLNRGDKFVDGADRHGLEFANKLDAIDEVLAITQDKFPDTHYRINELAKNFMGNAPYHATMTQAEFQQKFQDIIEHNPPYDNNVKPSIKEVMQQNNMQKISSNIFHQVDAFRANKALVYEMVDYTAQYHTADELKNKFRPKIAQYIKDYASIPAFMKRFENLTGEKLGIDNPEMYKNIINHTNALANIQADTLNLNMKLINRGRAAYKVDQEHGNTTKMGKRLDRPFAKWIDKSEGGLTRGWRNGVSIFTKTAFQAGPVLGLGMIGGTLVGGPLGTAIGVGIGVGAKTLLAKFSHTTKEHEGHLRDQARDLQRTSAYRQRIFDAVNNGEYKRYHKILPNRKGVEYRNFLRYIKTSHNELVNSETQSADILQLAQKEEILSSAEKQALTEKVAKALARLDLYKETGQNFFGSDNESVAEKEFRDIKQAVLLGKARLGGGSLDGIRTETSYRQEKNILENQYNAVWKDFKKMRRNIARKGAIKTGAIAGGISYLASSALSGNETTSGITETQHTTNTSGHWNPGENLEDHFISGDVDAPLKTTISNPNYASGKFEITAGVDDMMFHNVAGAKADLTSKISSVDSYIKSHFSGTNQQTLLDAFKPETLAKIQQDAINAGVDEGNASLLANRYVEGIEEIAKAHVEAGKVDSPITEISSNIIHQPSVARAAGNVEFRTMGVKMKYINQEAWEKVVSHQRNIPGGEWVDNTFKMGKDQENDAPSS